MTKTCKLGYPFQIKILFPKRGFSAANMALLDKNFQTKKS